MSAPQILSDLRRRGVELRVRGDRLRWRPRAALTMADQEELSRHKIEILRWLVPRPREACVTCRGTRYWRHAQHGHWLCYRCHPPSSAEIVGEEVGQDPAPATAADWGTDREPLVNWFLTEGQHRIPAGPFQLTPWIEVTHPERFKESILFDIACGPDGPRSRCGAVTDDLRRLKRVVESGVGDVGGAA